MNIQQDLERLQSGLVELTASTALETAFRPVSINSRIRELMLLLRQPLLVRRISSRLCLTDYPIYVRVPSDPISQAIFNILSIFMETMSAGTQLIIASKLVDQELLLTVRSDKKPAGWKYPIPGNFDSLLNAERPLDMHYHVARAILVTCRGAVYYTHLLRDTRVRNKTF